MGGELEGVCLTGFGGLPSMVGIWEGCLGETLAGQPRCPECSEPLETPQVRVMPDGVAEYRCPHCSWQIPMVVVTQLRSLGCEGCGTDPAEVGVLRGVDSSGLLNLVSCEGCGRVLGRYWGLM